MRFALFHKLLPLPLLFAALAHSQGPPPQQVNPHTQIRWPLACASQGMTYSYQTNTCVKVGPVGPGAGEVQFNMNGTWNSVPGFTFDPNSNTLSAPNLTVPGTANVHIPPSGVQWPPVCTSGVYVPATNTCVPPGTAANPGGAPPQVQYNAGGAFQGITGSSVDNAGNVRYPQMQTGTSPMADIRNQGAVLDATHTPVDAAFTAAINTCNAANGNSCQVLLPCGGVDGCFINNGTTVLPATPSGKTVELNIQGTLHLETGSTLKVPSGYSFTGKAAGGSGQFQSLGATANILGPVTNGTLGASVPGVTTGSLPNGSTSLTIVDTTGHVAGETVRVYNTGSGGVIGLLLYTGTVSGITGNVLTVAPSNAGAAITNMAVVVSAPFVPVVSATPTGSKYSNFHPASVIGVSGVQTCTAVSASRDGTISYNAPNTTFSTGAAITQISLAGNVLTVYAANTFSVGQSVGIVGLKVTANQFLNGQTVTIASQFPDRFTAAFTHADVILVADTGSVTTCTSSSGVPESIRMPVGQTVQISCPSDHSFDQNQTIINGQDWPANQISVWDSPSVPITQIGIASNVLTVVANNNFSTGWKVTFGNMGAATYLNNQTVTLGSVTPTQFTAIFGHANVTLAADTGTAYADHGITGTTNNCTLTGFDDYNYEIVRIDNIDSVPITQIGIASNVLTVVANNTFSNGETMYFSQMKTNTYLLGQTVTILNATPTQFTAAYTHTPVTLGAETGVVGRENIVAGSTLYATFGHAHAPADLWGMGTISTSDPAPTPGQHLDMQAIRIASGYGPQLYMDNTAVINLTGVGAYPQSPGYPASSAIQCDGCWWGQWDSIQAFAGAAVFTCATGTVVNCKTPSYPHGLRCSQDPLREDGIGCATNLTIHNPTVIGGIKVDGNGQDNSNGSGWNILLSNYVAEQSYEGAILVDNSKGLGGDLHVWSDMIVPSDSYIKNEQHNFAATDCCLLTSFASLGTLTYQTRFIPLTNKYWMNGVSVGGGVGSVNAIVNPALVAPHTSSGVLTDGTTIVANIRGSGANLSPSLIPFPTLSMTPNPTCTTYCTTVPGPDGVANSAIEVQSTPAGAQVILIVGTTSVKTWTGDWIITGVQVSPGTNIRNQQPGSPFGQNNLFYLRTNSTTELLQGGLNTFSSINPTNQVNSGGLLPLTGDSWQPGINVITVVQGDQTLHGIVMNVVSGSGVSGGNRFWNPWVMLIPGPNNPGWSNLGVTYPGYDGVTTRQDVMRLARELLHGYVPPNAPAGGGLLATCPGCRYLNLAVAAARRGTFACTAGGTITVPNANAVATSDITFSLNTAGGTPAAPAMKTPGNGTNFQVTCGSADTSTYNYAVWN